MYLKTPQCQVQDLTDLYLAHFGYNENGFFVDIGAFNGYNWSNTYCLSQAGWRGLLVEPHPLYFLELKELYKDNQRVILENVCIGKENGFTKLYLGGSNSTIKPEVIDIYNDIEWAKFSGLRHDSFEICKLFTLDTILEKYDCPVRFEVLSIDVEGAEIDVLKKFSVLKWQPRMVIIEAHEQYEDNRLSRKSRWINAYFCKYGYEKIYSDYINSIYLGI